MGEDAFNKRFQPIEEMLGNVEIEYVPSNGSLQGFEEMFAAGIKPDIIIDQNVFALQDLDIIFPMDELLEKEGIDLSDFDPALLDSIRAYDKQGGLVGLPDGTSNVGLYINQEVFDLFGIEYPSRDVPLTWQEVINLARKMTAKRNEVQYIGLAGLSPYALSQFAPAATDPDTGEILINQNEAYKRYFDLMAEFYNIPGVLEEESLYNAFVEKRAAMMVITNTWFLVDLQESGDPGPIDLVPFPVWPDMPTTGPLGDTTPMMITNYSENKELAAEVLKAYFSPEIILDQVRMGATVPPLIDKMYQEEYAKDLEVYQDKNLDAYYVLERATPKGRISRWDQLIDFGSVEAAIKEGKDVITALRELEEESVAKINDAIAAQ